MLSVEIITDREEIERRVPLCRELARQSEALLPFQNLRHPLVWWDHFNNVDGTDFNSKRGTNFLGSRSRLQKLFLLAAYDGQDLAGTVPLVQYTVEVPGEKGPRKLITLPGDFFISYQDFTIAPGRRKDAVGSLLHAMSGFLDSHDLVILPYVPETSPNIPHIRECIRELLPRGFRCTTSMTGRRGGLRAWTIEPIFSCLHQMADRTKDEDFRDDLLKLASDIEACPPMHLLFARTRSILEGRVRDAADRARGEGLLEGPLASLEALLADEPVLYPYIALPADAESYLMTMSRETRRYFRRYGKEYENLGGFFEKVPSEDIRSEDIDDYLRLHRMRWGEGSVSIRNEPSEKFHKDLCRRLSAEGVFTLFFARFQGRRIAAHSCIDIGRRREGHMTGRDPSFNHTRASRLLYLHTIIDAIHQGFHTYDLGMGWYAYKMSFTKTSSRTLNFFISHNASPIDPAKLFLGYECMIPEDTRAAAL